MSKELTGVAAESIQYKRVVRSREESERRRHALLQAAATIQAGVYAADNTHRALACALNDAEILLEEIEKREKAQS